MASSNYIRIYVNGKKVRSTGKEKWQRDGVLTNMGIGLVPWYEKHIADNQKLENFDREYFRYMRKSADLLYSEAVSPYINLYNDEYTSSKVFRFAVEYIRKTPRGKKSLGYFFVPFQLVVRKVTIEGTNLSDEHTFAVPRFGSPTVSLPESGYVYNMNFNSSVYNKNIQECEMKIKLYKEAI